MWLLSSMSRWASGRLLQWEALMDDRRHPPLRNEGPHVLADRGDDGGLLGRRAGAQ